MPLRSCFGKKYSSSALLVIQETLRVMSSKGKAAKKRALEKKEEAATAAKEKAEVEVSAEKNEPKLKPGEFGHPVPVVPLEKSALKPAERVGLIEGISADMYICAKAPLLTKPVLSSVREDTNSRMDEDNTDGLV